jgi:hypothetical protein
MINVRGLLSALFFRGVLGGGAGAAEEFLFPCSG